MVAQKNQVISILKKIEKLSKMKTFDSFETFYQISDQNFRIVKHIKKYGNKFKSL